MALSKLTDIRKSLSVEVEDLQVNGITTFTNSVSIGGTLTYQDVTNVDSVVIITAQAGINITGCNLTIPDKIIHTGDTNTSLRFPAADTITLETAGSERLRITSTGTLQVQGDGNAYLQLERYQNNANGSRVRFVKSRSDTVGTNAIVQDGDTLGVLDFYGSDGNSGTRGAASISAEVDGTPGSADMPGRLVFKTVPDGSTVLVERLRITSAGKVGINSTSPTNMLDVVGTADMLGLYRNDFTGNSGAGLNLNFGRAKADGSLFNCARIAAVGSDNTAQNGQLRFSVLDSGSISEKLRIDSYGKVTLGTFTPSSNSAAYMFTVADPTNSLGNCGITIRAGTGGGSNTNQGSIFYSNATSGTGEYAGYLQYNHNDNWFRIGTNSAERFRITSTGDVEIADGNLIVASGHGIDFSATPNTGTSELFNDYEEGTFTPRLGPHNNHSIYENGLGKYTKIGNTVFYGMSWINKNATSFPTNARIEIWNLPFTHQQTSTSEHVVMASLMMHNVQFASNHKHYFYTIPNSNNLLGLKSRDGNSWEEWSTADWNQSSLYFYASGTFFVN